MRHDGAMELSTLLAFCAAWGLLVVLPGPDTALVVALGVTRGRLSAVGAAFGSLTALAVHVTAAGLGLSALLASSAAVFTVFKLAGAAYLCVLGLRLVLARAPQPQEASVPSTPSGGGGYPKGLLTGLSNPKSAIFFLTFLPQFVDRHHAVGPQLAVLGALTLLLASVWLAILVAATNRLRAAAVRPRVREVTERLTGTFFVVLASRLATVTR
jgi:threonine/homoserine/homoserine lactone efflux protein